MIDNGNNTVDIHVHAGIVGDDEFKGLGRLSENYRNTPTFKIFQKFARLNVITDKSLHENLLKTISTSGLYGVVCLALDHVFDSNGAPAPAKSDVWVSNEYILKLQNNQRSEFPKIYFGCSVHPYDVNFERRVKECVDKNAVLIKWLPSAMQFDLADPRILKALKFLATAKNGKPLPLLLHTGVEYAVPTSNVKTQTYDFHSWSSLENQFNNLPFKTKLYTPRVAEIRKNIQSALEAGAIIIFAHCGLPYIASGIFSFLEHSDFETVKSYLNKNINATYTGRCYADISAFCTPFRKAYFNDIKALPQEYLFYGSDYPTPAFEISGSTAETLRNFKAILEGDFSRIIIPQDNLLDVNYRQLKAYFAGSPLFTNFYNHLIS